MGSSAAPPRSWSATCQSPVTIREISRPGARRVRGSSARSGQSSTRRHSLYATTNRLPPNSSSVRTTVTIRSPHSHREALPNPLPRRRRGTEDAGTGVNGHPVEYPAPRDPRTVISAASRPFPVAPQSRASSGSGGHRFAGLTSSANPGSPSPGSTLISSSTSRGVNNAACRPYRPTRELLQCPASAGLRTARNATPDERRLRTLERSGCRVHCACHPL